MSRDEPLPYLERHDALPEENDWRDTGCNLFSSCLNCPLPVCRYDKPGAAAAYFRQVRDAKIIALHASTVPAPTIAAAMGLSLRTVFRVIQESRPERPERPEHPERRDRIREMRASGASVADIAEAFGITPGRVEHVCIGLKARSSDVEKRNASIRQMFASGHSRRWLEREFGVSARTVQRAIAAP